MRTLATVCMRLPMDRGLNDTPFVFGADLMASCVLLAACSIDGHCSHRSNRASFKTLQWHVLISTRPQKRRQLKYSRKLCRTAV